MKKFVAFVIHFYAAVFCFLLPVFALVGFILYITAPEFQPPPMKILFPTAVVFILLSYFWAKISERLLEHRLANCLERWSPGYMQ